MMTTRRLFQWFGSSAVAVPHEPQDGPEVNPPAWPNDGENTVLLITPETPAETLLEYQDVQQAGIFRPTNHFSNRRTALMFVPGVYDSCPKFQVGYYTQVLGLGASASDVEFTRGGGPYCPAYDKDIKGGGSSLDTFWRSAENFSCVDMKWAVSQAAPLRRIHVKGNLFLSDGAAYASGGHAANISVEGKIIFGSQQQFCVRSASFGSETKDLCAWSTVLVDCVGKMPPASESVTIHTPSVTVEKPYLVLDSNHKYKLHVPLPRCRAANAPSMGPILTGEQCEIRDFTNVYVAKAKIPLQDADNEFDTDQDVARKINKALRQGKDVILSPGIYHLNQSIEMARPDQVLLGIGMATLVAPADKSPCIYIPSGLPGVRVAGCMLEASHLDSSVNKTACLLEWGEEGVSDVGVADNPGVLTDIFCRVGGSSLDRLVSTNVMIRIRSDHVLGDNLWLWRADHVQLGQHELPNFPPLSYHQTVEGEVPVETGLEVNGNHVTIHGLAVEHTNQHQVIWNGQHGCVQFYQCELPYDVSTNFGRANYMGYKVNTNVEQHYLGGAGVYSNFRDDNVLVKSAMELPNVFDSSDQVVNPFTVHLDNQGVIMTVVTDGKQNGGGPALPNKGPARFPPTSSR